MQWAPVRSGHRKSDTCARRVTQPGHCTVQPLPSRGPHRQPFRIATRDSPGTRCRSADGKAGSSSQPVAQQGSVAAGASTQTGPGLSEQAQELVARWLSQDRNAETRTEVEGWVAAGDEATIQKRLGQRLEFGTAGLRGVMGAGYNAMNNVVVQQTSQGLCYYLQQTARELLYSNGIVIGYDGRHHSREFAHVTAAVFASQGVPVHIFSHYVPTPFVAAAVAELETAAGVMVTASHNPKQDNGYKVYWGNGCQIIPPHDEGIAAAINTHLDLWTIPDTETLKPPVVKDPTNFVTERYYARLAKRVSCRSPADNATAQPVTYTPLHGVGGAALVKAFEVVGLPKPHVVPAQANPDPDFPTVLFPNPEEGQGTWKLAFEEGRSQGSQLVIANDPDADRLAVAEACDTAPGGYRAFTGNEIGALLAHWLWTQHKRKHPQVPASDCVMLASVVSSAFLGRMAAKEGFKFEQTLTGFKWLGNKAIELQAQGKQVLFAYEEAIGFMPGEGYRDKDGIMSAVCLCELAADLYARGTTLQAHLAQLYTLYGTPVYRAGYVLSPSPALTRSVFDRLRHEGSYAKTLGGHTVTWVRDLGTGLDTRESDSKAKLPWRVGDMMITYGVSGGAVLTLRASGTEPKLKWYLEVLSDDVSAAERLAVDLIHAVDRELLRVDETGFKRS